MWPFGRRGGKAAKIRDGQSPAQAASLTQHPPQQHDVAPGRDVSHGLRKAPSRRSSRQKRRSRSTAQTARDYEKGPLPAGKQRPPRRSTSFDDDDDDDITALPLQKRLEQSPHLRPILSTAHGHHIPYSFHPDAPSHSHSHPDIARERRKLKRPQSLRHSTSINDHTGLLRRRSTRKRGHDSIREEEIRAMSMPLPQKRPAGHPHGMLRRDSKKVKGGLNRHLERPTSNISLPLEDSIHSSMSGTSETRAWRVSALDMFSPRPKIRWSVGSPPYGSATRTSPTSPLDKYSNEKEQEAAAERKKAKRNSRIDDLADTLDAGALRQILERDRRRRDAKRKADDERLKRKLERRAEKQRLADQRTAELAGTPSTPKPKATGAVGLGIERDAPEPMEDVRPSTPPPPQQVETTTAGDKIEVTQLPTPVESPMEEPVVSDAQAVRYSRASISPTPDAQGHARGPSNVSDLPALHSEMIAQDPLPETSQSLQDPHASGSLYPVETVDTTATSKRSFSRRRSSETGRTAAWASFFRRGKRNSRDQGRITPSELSFSNTSRESMSRQPLPAHLVATVPPPTQPVEIRRPSSVPRRTMSKFREDLPEYSMTPPDSRLQSPETASTSAIATRRRSHQPSDLRIASPSPGPDAPRTDSPVSPGVPATGLMSQSLASVDSEGSWLSGKPMKRISNKSHIRSSGGSSSVMRRNDEFNTSYEELGIPDDEYFKRLTPQPGDRRSSVQSSEVARRASSTAMAAMDISPEIDEEVIPTTESTSDEELVKHNVGRQPTVVHRPSRVKSAEGLLSFYQPEKSSPEEEKLPAAQGDGSTEPDSPTSDTEPATIQRAKSIDLGKHHSRQLSAGSAKLLDIPARRSSVDPKRSSLASQNTLPQQ